MHIVSFYIHRNRLNRLTHKQIQLDTYIPLGSYTW
jgi:hypothetical protein